MYLAFPRNFWHIICKEICFWFVKFSDSYKWYSTCQHRWKKSKPLDMMMSYIRTFVTSLVISSIVYHWDHTLVHWGIIDITIICHNCFNITTDDILGHCSLLCCMSDHLRWHSLLHHNYVLHILMFSDVIHHYSYVRVVVMSLLPLNAVTHSNVFVM